MLPLTLGLLPRNCGMWVLPRLPTRVGIRRSGSPDAAQREGRQRHGPCGNAAVCVSERKWGLCTPLSLIPHKSKSRELSTASARSPSVRRALLPGTDSHPLCWKGRCRCSVSVPFPAATCGSHGHLLLQWVGAGSCLQGFISHGFSRTWGGRRVGSRNEYKGLIFSSRRCRTSFVNERLKPVSYVFLHFSLFIECVGVTLANPTV